MKRRLLQMSGTHPTISEKCELFEMAQVGRTNRADLELLGMFSGGPILLSAEARRRWPFAGNPRHGPIWTHLVIIPQFSRLSSDHFYPRRLLPELEGACLPASTRPSQPAPVARSQTFLFGDLSGSYAPRSYPPRPVGSGNMSGSSVLRYCVIRSRG